MSHPSPSLSRPRRRWPLLARRGAVVFAFWVVVAVSGQWLAPYSPGEFVAS